MMKLAALLLALTASPVLAAPVPAELGKAFRLEKGRTASIDGGKALLRIVKFINSPCPKGARCIWSGQAVDFELTVGGKPVPRGAKDAPYDVETKDSDYATYAVFMVDDPLRACARAPAPARGECLRSLARRRSDPALCREIKDERTRGFCLEDLAEELHLDSLCPGVASPSQYCLYLKAKKAGAPALCAGIVLTRWREQCGKELTQEAAP